MIRNIWDLFTGQTIGGILTGLGIGLIIGAALAPTGLLHTSRGEFPNISIVIIITALVLIGTYISAMNQKKSGD
jgi:hypothetical protein